MNYKDTLNLPKTSFPMKANLPVLEPKIISFWQDLDIYQRLRKERAGNKKFILHDGPPYANGLIHIGHALNKILKDIVIKYKVLKGYDCPFNAGWDCHGLPIEYQLFKELKLTKHDVEAIDFRKKAGSYALKFVELQKQDFIRLGLFSDWDNPYITLNPEYECSVISLLGDLTEKGYIYRGRKPVNWCAACETALAEAEVEYADKESDSIYFLFKESRGENYFLVWTTTPWTLVSNTAVAVHPDLEYCLVNLGDKKVILAKKLIPTLEEKFNTTFEIIKSLKGNELEGIELNHPFFDRTPKIVLADFVSSEEGSGCVHIAPGHGQEDFSLTKKYNLEMIMPVNEKGEFEEPLEFKAKKIKEANELVLKKLKESNMLIKHQKITHSYPHCWRCKQPIIFRATFQWFLNVNHKDLRKDLLKEIDRVQWVPENGRERIKAMVTTRPDWCLSRQRLWGVPIPALKCKSCSEVTLNKKVIDLAAQTFKTNSSDSWFILDVSNFIPKNFKCPKCGLNDFEKEFDILDVWFESGASFLAVVKKNPDLIFPADLYLEGSDQHRGWFQASLIPAAAVEKIAPFKTILTHGFVVDAKGKKMSKSLGNVIAPQKVYSRFGAEILRLWAAYADYSEDVKISEDILKQLADMYRKVRNTIKFILGNISDFNLDDFKTPFSELAEVDRYMAAKAVLFLKETGDSYEEFSFYKACQKIFNFCNLDLSSFYLDILKDRLYTFPKNSQQRRGAQFVLYHILKILLQLAAPILSFTCEEAYGQWESLKDKKDSIYLSDIEQGCFKGWLDEKLLGRWEKILGLRGKVLKEIENKREAGIIGSSLEAQAFLSFADKDYEFYSGLKEVLEEIFIVSSVVIEKGNFEIIVEKAQGQKCMRCWKQSENTGKDTEYPDTCVRCLEALKTFYRIP
ncbi:MAG: isoleucine--tRNA ligase [Candidatus Omnitrophota bacterium]